MSIRGTRVPETAGRSRGAPPPVRYDTQHAWPGIYGVFDARCICTWAYGPYGRYQVKYVDAMCRGEHRGGSPWLASPSAATSAEPSPAPPPKKLKNARNGTSRSPGTPLSSR